MYKYFFSNWNKIKFCLKRYKKKMTVLFLLAVIVIILSVILPYFNMKMINAFVYEELSYKHLKIVLMYLLILVILSFITYISSICHRNTKLTIEKDIRAEVMSRMIAKNLSDYCDNELGDVDTSIKYDVPTFVDVYLEMMIDIPITIIETIFILAILFYLGWYLAALVIVMQVTVVLFQHIMCKKMEKVSGEVREKLMALNEHLSNIVMSLSIIKHIGAEKYVKNKYDSCADDYIEKSMKHCKLASLSSNIMEIMMDFNIIVILVLGSIRIFNGILGVGVLISLVQYATNFFSNVSSLMNKINEIHGEMSQVKKVINILEIKEEKNESEEKGQSGTINKIVISDVMFNYSNAESVFEGCDAELKEGTLNFIIGSSGSGKSTLLKLIEGEFKPKSGEIFAYGGNGEKTELCKKDIGVVPQDNIFYTDSIYNNISLGKDISKEKIEDVCRKCHIYDDIDALQDRFNTILSCGMNNLSGGQLKRLSLARTLLQKKPILLLDEPTAGLDKESTSLIMNTIRTCANDKIIVIVTHDLKIIQPGDNLYELTDKKFVKTKYEQLSI